MAASAGNVDADSTQKPFEIFFNIFQGYSCSADFITAAHYNTRTQATRPEDGDHILLVDPVNFSHQALEPVAIRRTADSLRYGERNSYLCTRFGQRARFIKHIKVSPGKAFSYSYNFADLSG